MNEIKIQRVKETLAVWNWIHDNPPKLTDEFWTYKERACITALNTELEEVLADDYRGLRCHCPLCEQYYGEPDCPLGDCGSTGNNGCPCEQGYYGKWRHSWTDSNPDMKSQMERYSRLFIKQLEKILKELESEQ